LVTGKSEGLYQRGPGAHRKLFLLIEPRTVNMSQYFLLTVAVALRAARRFC